MAVSELATMEPGELADRLVEARKELFNLRFQLATGQLDNTARVRHVRKEVARIMTYLRQYELAGDEGAALGVSSAAAVTPVPEAEEDEEES